MEPIATSTYEISRVDSPPDSAVPGDHHYKMKDLCEKAGVSRQLVHFYIQQGLLPEGKKTGKNMAYYSEKHLERLLLVRRLQHEQFLPLKAIAALLEERDEAFSPAQQKHMREVRAAMPETLAGSKGPRETVNGFAYADKVGLPREDLKELVDVGLIAAVSGENGSKDALFIAKDDVWRLELYAELRRSGFTSERGFSMRDVAMFDETMEALVMREARLIAMRAGELSPGDLADLLTRAMPVIGSLLARLHSEKAKHLLASL
ncbi:MAG: MerR family transcriptional regulator [Polyangiaceae bacterium]|nr:MerR family transcriptional regulator [Polyangiaceae bacterium]